MKLSHSTFAFGSSAASFVHSSAITFPSMPWWLGHDSDLWLPGAECGDVISGHDRILLAWPRIVGGHPPDGSMCVRKNGGRSKHVIPRCCYSQCFAIAAHSDIGLPVPAHVGFVVLPPTPGIYSAPTYALWCHSPSVRSFSSISSIHAKPAREIYKFQSSIQQETLAKPRERERT